MTSRRQRVKRRDLHRALYALERRWGLPADLYYISISAPDYTTGTPTVTKVKTKIPKFVSFSVDIKTKFDYDITYIKANSNFAYGNTFQVGDRITVFRYPGIINPETHKIHYDGKWYDFQTLEQLDANIGYIGYIRLTQETNFGQVLNVIVNQRLIFDQDITVEKE